MRVTHDWVTFKFGGYYGGTKCARCGRYSDWWLLGAGRWCWVDLLALWFPRFRCASNQDRSPSDG